MLQLPDRARTHLAAAAHGAYPHETCGVLVGRQDHGHAAVERVVQAANLDTSRPRHRYLLDPDDFRSADEAARADGLEIVGIWHTHPDHPAVPSETDRAAAWEGWSYLIAAVTPQGVGELRSWRLVEERFVEEGVEP